MFITDTTVPGLQEARAVQAEIKRLGIQDVELFWDAEISIWCVVQVRKMNTGLITMDRVYGSDVDPYLLFYIKNETGAYRAPNQTDVQSVVAIVRGSHHWWAKGADAFTREVEVRDEIKRARKEERHRERLQPHTKALKRAIRQELG